MRPFPLLLGMLASTNLFAAGFYIGTYTKDSASQGIYHARLDPSTGAIDGVKLAARAANPSYLAAAPNGKFLYAAMEGEPSEVGAFRVENDGSLQPLGQLSSEGGAPCHVSLDRTGKYLFVANYTGGSIASFALRPDGSIERKISVIPFTGSGPDESRQEKPHAHGIYPSLDNRFVYVCDLGTDKVRICAFDAATGGLREAGFGMTPGGSGPRHLAFTPDGKYAYVANEMRLTVTGMAVDRKTGALDVIETVPVHDQRPQGRATLAEIFVHPNGKWLYVSSRGDDTIAVYSIAKDGKLTRLQNAPAGVKTPRGFAIDPAGKWIVAAGQDDDRLTALSIDGETGKLSLAKSEAAVGSPVSILFGE